MNFSAWSIKNPIPGILLFIMLGLAGLMCFHWMKIQQSTKFACKRKEDPLGFSFFVYRSARKTPSFREGRTSKFSLPNRAVKPLALAMGSMSRAYNFCYGQK